MSTHTAQAILYGLALGDALGSPTEFKRLSAIKAQYGAAGIQEPPDPALFTDDTQMTLALAEGLLDAGLTADTDTQIQAIGRRFIDWRHSPENDRSPGTTCLAGIERYEQGMDWHESGLVGSKGCGSAMRVAPIGYLYQHDPARLREIAIASSVITHRHPTAIAASVAAAYLVKLALDGDSPATFIRQTMAFTDGLSDELDHSLLRIGHVLGWVDEEAALTHLGQGWTGEEAVALALYCVLRYPDDYVACVGRAANTDGDSDSIACIAGGILGARLGLAAIPPNWIARCEQRESLANLGVRLAAARDRLQS